MFPDGAVQYIDKLKQYIPIAGGVLRTALDMGCGVGNLSHVVQVLIIIVIFGRSDCSFSIAGCEFWGLPTI